VIERELVQGEYIIKGALFPRNPNTVFAEKIHAPLLNVLVNNKVRVDLRPIPAVKPRYVDSAGNRAVPAYIDVDQVIYSIGQNTDLNDAQSWPGLLKSVLQSAISNDRHIIKDRYGRAVGLQSDDGRIRVLGATALSHPDFQSQITTASTEFRKFFRSLTDQARVRVGITLSAVTVAEANNFWSGTINENINTASLGDLADLMKQWDLELQGPQTWLDMRGARIPPLSEFEVDDLRKRKMHY
jgi:hypothetical protein